MGSRSRLSSHFFLLLLLPMLLQILGVDGLILSPFCEKATSNTTTCPDIPTFDLVGAEEYGGLWYEIGSTAQFKLLVDAGVSCAQANYTVHVSNDSSRGATLSLLKSGVRALGPVATVGVASINRGSKDVCEDARDVCSFLAPPSDMMQSVRELCKIAFTIGEGHPGEAETLTNVAKQLEGYAFNISEELPLLAKHVKGIQTVDGYLSQGNGTAKASVEQIRLEMISVAKHAAVIEEFVAEMAAARKCLVAVALKLFIAGEFVNSVDVTEASVLIAAAEQSVLFKTKQIAESLVGMKTASELILANPYKPNQRVSWNLPAVATQNATSRGRLQISSMGLSAPVWIIALEGVPGNEAGLAYSCTQNLVTGTIEQVLFVIARKPTIQPSTLDRFMDVALSLGIDLDCENPFLTSSCDCPHFGEAPAPR